MATEVGHISHMLASTGESETPLTEQLKRLTSQILIIAGAAVVISIALNLSRGEKLPQGLHRGDRLRDLGDPDRPAGGRDDDPLLGHADARKANAIMKRLRSTETLGSTSAINSDKTGTLTLNQMTAVEMTIAGAPLHDHRRRLLDRREDPALGRPARGAARPVPAADGARARTPSSRTASSIGDPTEGALVVLAGKGGLERPRPARPTRASRSCPFDAELQDDGDVPRDEGRAGARTWCAA